MKEPFKGFYFLLAFLISSYSFKLAEYPYLVKTPFLLPASPSFKRIKMKYTDKLNLINTFSGIALAVIPYLLTLIFNWDEITKTKTEQVFLILTVVVIFILT